MNFARVKTDQQKTEKRDNIDETGDKHDWY